MTLASTTVWEVRTTGDDDNGGGYKSDAGTTDYSQQDAAELSLSDLATSGIGVTTLTSVTGGFTAAMVGNVIQIRSGTNVTAGAYEVTGRSDTNTVTLDRAPDDGVGGIASGVGDLGGALASPGMASGFASVDDMVVHVKSGTYTLTTSTPNIAAGRINILAQIRFEGYGSSRGDLGTKPVVSAGAVSSIIIWSSPTVAHGSPGYTKNIKVDGNSQSAVVGFDANERNHDFLLCEAINCVTGFDVYFAQSCLASGNSGTGIRARVASRCTSHDNDAGFDPAAASNASASDCLAYGNTNAGFKGSQRRWQLAHCTADGNGGDGFSMTSNGIKCVSCLATKNLAFGFDPSSDSVLFNCAGWMNTSGNVDSGIMDNDEFVTVTADPYVDQAGNDYRPNNDSPGGAQLRGAGQAIPGQIGNRDIGAVQHADPAGGGGGGLLVHPGMTGGMRG